MQRGIFNMSIKTELIGNVFNYQQLTAMSEFLESANIH